MFHVGDTVSVSYYCNVESEQGKECRDEADCQVCGKTYIYNGIDEERNAGFGNVLYRNPSGACQFIEERHTCNSRPSVDDNYHVKVLLGIHSREGKYEVFSIANGPI